jgi:hypothetical protein
MKFNKSFEYSLIFKKMAFKVTRSGHGWFKYLIKANLVFEHDSRIKTPKINLKFVWRT